MHKTALVFSGQGSQHEGMGREVINRYSFAKSYFKVAGDILNMDMLRLCCSGTADELRDTRVSQPAILLVSYLRFLGYCEENEEKALFFAGHSLGEYTALLAAGIIKFSEAVRLIGKRSSCMSEASRKTEGTMLAVICEDKMKELLSVIRKRKFLKNEALYIGCINSRSQLVLTGSVKSILNITEDIIACNCGKVVPLRTSGAFHSKFMKRAGEEFKKVVESAEFTEMPEDRSVISNVTGVPYRSISEIRQNLILQLTQPVQWLESVNYMKESGVDKFIEFGAKSILSSLIRQEVIGNAFPYN